MDILYSICESSSGVPFVLLPFSYRVRGPNLRQGDLGVRFGMRSVTGRNTVKVDPGLARVGDGSGFIGQRKLI